METLPARTVGRNGWYKTQFRARQPRPYKDPLPYLTYGVTATYNKPAYTAGAFSTAAVSQIQGNQANSSVEAKLSQARAYDKIVAKMKGEASAMLAVNLAERKQSFHMIANRALQLLNGARALRNGDIKGGLRIFGFKLSSTREGRAWVRQGKGRTYILQSKVDRDEFLFRRKVKTGGSLWLEYWFGWKPLVDDCYGAVNVLQDVNLQLHNFATGTGKADFKRVVNEPWYYQGRWWVHSSSMTAAFGSRYRARYSISSPNRLKASQLGLTNPATVAWELIPFSFLVDWFFPVGRFLDSYTDLVGLNVSEVQLTTKRTASYHFLETSPWGVTSKAEEAFQSSRIILGVLPIPGFRDRAGNGIASLTRAATAVSLLTGFFKTSKWS